MSMGATVLMYLFVKTCRGSLIAAEHKQEGFGLTTPEKTAEGSSHVYMCACVSVPFVALRAQASRRAGVAASPEAIRDGLATLEALLPGFTPNLDTLKAADWVRRVAGRGGGAEWGGVSCRYQPKLNRTRCNRARRRAWPMLDNGVARDKSPHPRGVGVRGECVAGRWEWGEGYSNPKEAGRGA